MSGPREVPAGGAAGRSHSRDPNEGSDAHSDGPDDGECNLPRIRDHSGGLRAKRSDGCACHHHHGATAQ